MADTLVRTASRHDPITLEILSNALLSVADEMFVALQRSAYSTNIKERHDHSTALFDVRGRLVTQAQKSLPLHVGGISGTVGKLVEKYRGDIHEGDVFVGNDPYAAAGTHLPDITIIAPVFHGGRCVGFSACTAHHADIGGSAVGGASGGLTEIFQEGFRIPLVRLFSRFTMNRDMFEIFLLNVRGTAERRGDYNAQFAAIRLGAIRLGEICDRFGVAGVENAFDEIIGRTERRMARALEQIPPGEYRFADVMDDDGVAATNLPIVVTLRKAPGGRLQVDFAGTAGQTPGNINSPWVDTLSTVLFALKCVVDPAIPNNHGVMAAIDVTAPEGSLVRPSFPAAVTNRSATDQRVVDAVLGALAQALPDKVVAAANGSNTGVYIYGKRPGTGEDFYFFETMGGGFGGRATKDGRDAVQVHVTNTANTPVEALEREFPLLVEEYAIVEDSGGAGRYRGGCGLRRVVRPLAAGCTFGGTGERFTHQPWGLFGGQPGETGGFALRADDGTLTRLPTKVPGVALEPGTSVVMQTPGAGGYGPPTERSHDALAADRADGKFSAAYLDRHYGKA